MREGAEYAIRALVLGVVPRPVDGIFSFKEISGPRVEGLQIKAAASRKSGQPLYDGERRYI
jgi:hypothetical protein